MVMRILTIFITTFFMSEPDLDVMLEVIKQVETRNQPKLIGDGGRAFGVIQVHGIAVKEINRITRKNYKHKEMFDVEVASSFFKDYMKVCSAYYYRKEKKKATEEDLVRMWNGGYTGYKKPSTENYYEKYLKWKKDLYPQSGQE